MATAEQPVTKHHFVFDSLPTARIMIGKCDGAGYETPTTRFNINVETTVSYSDHDGVIRDEQIHVCLALTPAQMVEVVKDFFEPATTNYDLRYPHENVFMGFLGRLLKKRWAVATSPVYKCPALMSDEDRRRTEKLRSAQW